MSTTKSNHYVPQWYQHRFIPSENRERKYYYLDLAPDKLPRPDGNGFYFRNAIRHLGPINCFCQEDLYSIFDQYFGVYAPDIVEKEFFGKIDDRGATAIELFSDYVVGDATIKAHPDLVKFMDAQSLRTPKGLNFLKSMGRMSHKEAIVAMQRLHQRNVTIWSEGVWEIVECQESPTKFIVSDHPVSTYNKAIFPGSPQHKNLLDAPVELLGTHTIFPLSLTRCLVITNLGYVRNPGASPVRVRENARHFAPTVMDMRKIQTRRQIPESEVIAINYILKSQAHRFIAAGRREWLEPEKHLKSRMWNKLSGPFFLMPDPRRVSFSSQILMGFNDGSAWGMDEYGRQPGRDDAKVKALRDAEWKTFQSAKRAWDQTFGKLSAEELREAMDGPGITRDQPSEVPAASASDGEADEPTADEVFKATIGLNR